MQLAQFLFGDSPATFPSALSLDESIRRLSFVVAEDTFLSGLRAHEGQRVFGLVSQRRVRLTWMTPFVSNIFRPRFVGRFETSGQTTILVGKFGVLPVVRAWASTFAMVGVLGAVVVAGQANTDLPSRALLMLSATGISASGFVAVRLSQWLTRGVRQHLASFVTASLSGNE